MGEVKVRDGFRTIVLTGLTRSRQKIYDQFTSSVAFNRLRPMIYRAPVYSVLRIVKAGMAKSQRRKEIQNAGPWGFVQGEM